jgi:hypothetical protein
MDYRAVAALITKTAGLLFVIFVLATFPERLADYVHSGQGGVTFFLGGLVLPTVIPLAAGLLLMLLPATISGVVMGKASDVPPHLPQELQTLVFAGIGLYLMVQSILDLVFYWTLHRGASELVGPSFEFDPETRAGFYTSIVALLFGICLMVGAKGLSHLLRKVRRAGGS